MRSNNKKDEEQLRSQNSQDLLEHQLQEAKENIEALMNSTDASVFIMGTDGNVIRANEAGAKQFGMTIAEIEGRSTKDLFPPDVWTSRNNKVEEAIRTKLPIRFEDWRGEIYAEQTIYPVIGAGENVSRLIVIARNITEQKRMEDALRENEERFHLLANMSGEFIWQLNLEGEIVYASPSAERLQHGYTIQDGMHHNFMEFFPESEYERLAQAFGRAIAGEEYQLMRFDSIRKDGSLFPIEVSATPIIQDGNIVGVFGVTRDITQLKQAEQTLRESKERFRTLVESAPLGIITCDPTGQIIDINASALKITGAPSIEEAKAVNLLTFPALVEAGISDLLQKCFDTGEAVIDDRRYTTQWGKTVDWHTATAPIQDEDGNVVLVQLLLEDVTERKQMETVLQESDSRLREAERLAKLGHWELDIRANKLFWSEEIYRIFEISTSEFEASYEDFLEMIHPDDRELVDHAYKESLKSKKLYSIDHRILLPDGRVKFVHERGENFYDEQDNPIRSLGTVQDITERKQIEDQLRKLSRSVESAPVSIIITDKDGNIEHVNPFFSTATGYGKDEVLGKNPNIFQSGRTSSETYSELWETILGGQTWGGEFINKKKSGEHYIEAAQISPIFDAHNNITHFVAIKQDITERRRAEDALREIEERFSWLTKMSGEYIWQLDLNGQLVYTSPSVERLHGYTPKEALQLHYTDFFPELELEHVTQAFAKALSGEEYQLLQFNSKRKDGSILPISVSTAPIIKDGIVVGVHGLSRDITERMQAEIALRESEERYRNIVEYASDIVYKISPEGFFDYVNPQALILTGYEKDELTGKMFIDLIHPRWQGRVQEFYLNQLNQKIPKTTFQFPIITKEGEQKWVEQTVNLIMNNEELIDIQGIVRDVTERVLVETALSESNLRYDELTKHIPVGVFRIRRLVSGEFKFEFISSRASQMLEIDPQEFLNSPEADAFDKLVHPDDLDDYTQAYENAMFNGLGDLNWTGRILIKEKIHWVEVQAKYALRENGEIIWDGILADVTERVKKDNIVRKQNRMLQALHAVTLDIGSATDILTLFSRIMYNATDLLEANQGGCLLLHDEQQNLLLTIDGIGIGEKLVGKFVRPGEGGVGEVFLTAEPLANQKFQFLTESFSINDLLVPELTLAVPLIGEERVIGVLVLFADNQRQAFSPEDVTVAEMFAAQASAAYRNIELFERTERELVERKRAEEREREQRALAEALRDTAEALNSSLELGEILTRILDRVGDIVRHDSVAIAWIDEHKVSFMKPPGYGSEQAQWIKQHSISVDDLFTFKHVMESAKPLVIPNTKSDPLWISQPETAWIQSHIEAPVVVNGKVVAIININSKEPGFYTATHARNLQAVADQVAIAVQNAMLFEEVQNLAIVDELTGLYNRRGFFEVCRREVGRLQRFGRPFSALFLDIDHFKQFNDRYSYETGDQVLRLVAKTLQQNVREIDVVGRYGGEELVALLPEIDQTSAVEIAERLREAVACLHVPSKQGALRVTISVGVSTLTPVQGLTTPVSVGHQGQMLDKLIAKAGEALHAAKQEGRNRVEIYKDAD